MLDADRRRPLVFIAVGVGIAPFLSMLREAVRTKLPFAATLYVERAMLERHLAALRGPHHYIAGSPAFIVTMRRELEHAGVSAQDIRIELFGGY